MKLVSKTPLTRSSVNGFTLIELITVISIMAIVLALVGPLTVNFVEKAQAQTEYIQLKNSLKKLSFTSFASSTTYGITFEGSSVIVNKADKFVSKKTFDYLSYTKQKVLFNANGYPEPEMLTVKKRNKTEKINIFKLVEGSDAQVKQ